MNYLSFIFLDYFCFISQKNILFICFWSFPITSAIPAILHRTLYGTKMYLWVLDLWPESVLVTGRVKHPLFVKILNFIVKYIYHKCDKIFISSEQMRTSIEEKNTKKNINLKISYLPNWAESLFYSSLIDKSKYFSIIPEGFIVLFAGNIGFAQDIDSLINCAKKLRNDSRIKFVFVGDGSEKKRLLDLKVILRILKKMYSF
ncbi:MAG: hypothetical protein IPH57_12685 [Saprospiraceae bacterium]|nr:hypothetical protein [Saprospiraceae bacterium]